jgi:hypothetical protein
MVRRGLKAATKACIKSWAPSKMLHAEDIADAVAYLIRDESLFGCSLEVRPTGRQIVDPRPAPGSKR